ncbi:AAEL008176-PA [Aedes aegypti]|uniref:AAEL008176-PA n=1 Tax=Aedes aegypti TaxID=7159 RepID=Q16ZK4_AEDAE|nr:AAEL008176-PA [Aedes aegypti]
MAVIDYMNVFNEFLNSSVDCKCTSGCGQGKPCDAGCNCNCASKKETGKDCCETGSCKK